MKIFLIAIFLFLVWLIFREKTPPLEPQKYSGKVQYVIDGDTVILSRSKERLRLWGVDAPELDQKGGQGARNALVDMVEGKQITFIKITSDRYGRTVARIFLKEQDINLAIIESGHAQEYCRYSKGFYGYYKK